VQLIARPAIAEILQQQEEIVWTSWAAYRQRGPGSETSLPTRS
jgi:hypothetical protein